MTGVALLGLGPMGSPMARRLLAAGPLTVWNRTASRAAEFAEAGARVAATPADAAEDVVLTVLPDLDQVESVLAGEWGLLRGWQERGVASPVLVVHGTVSPPRVAQLAKTLFDRQGVRVVDAPLSGGTVGAAAGTLSVMVGGDEPTARALFPLFEHFGRTVRYVGRSGAGALAKLCNQVIVASTVAAVSEAMALARTAGLDQEVLMELLRGGLADSELLRQKGGKWLADEYSAGGSAANQVKDLIYLREAAAAAGVRLSVADAVTALFAHMVERGDGALDHTGVIRTILAGRVESRDS